jgi:hypothetical protein
LLDTERERENEVTILDKFQLLYLARQPDQFTGTKRDPENPQAKRRSREEGAHKINNKN